MARTTHQIVTALTAGLGNRSANAADDRSVRDPSIRGDRRSCRGARDSDQHDEAKAPQPRRHHCTIVSHTQLVLTPMLADKWISH